MPEFVKCPICHSKTKWEGNSYRPFCSDRCRTQDLGHWATGRYALPAEEPLSEEEWEAASQSIDSKNLA